MSISLFNYWNTIEVGDFVTAKVDIYNPIDNGLLYSKKQDCKVVAIEDIRVMNYATKKIFFCKKIIVKNDIVNYWYFYSDKKTYDGSNYVGSWFKRKNYLLLGVLMLYYIIRGINVYDI